MSMKNTLTGITAAAALSISALAVSVAPAHAADPQVCVTGPAATPQTQPWLDFANTGNPLWPLSSEFAAMAAGVSAKLQKLSPAMDEDQVSTVDDALTQEIQEWRDRFDQTSDTLMAATSELVGSLVLAGVDQAEITEAMEAFQAEGEPLMVVLFEGGLQSAIAAYAGAVDDQVAFPVPSPVVVPSSTEAYAKLSEGAHAVDQLRDLALKRVAYSGTSQTCITTASLVVPAVKTVVGNASTVTVNATREGRASRGDFVVLVDGEQVATASDVSSATATVPADLAAGKHVLSVVFGPADGSPISTQSSAIKVATAKTKTVLKVAKVKPGKPIKATVRVTAAGTPLKATGTVSIKVGDTTVTGKVKKGKATVVLGKLEPGSYQLKAAYPGNESFAKSASKTVKLTVKK